MDSTVLEPPPATIERVGREPVTVDLLVRLLPPIIRDYLQETLEPLVRRLDDLESRPQLQYCGVWSGERTYVTGNVVTSAGSAWHCNAETTDRPGASPCWVLMVKRGSRGRPDAHGQRGDDA
jgi:hypothetical protein